MAARNLKTPDEKLLELAKPILTAAAKLRFSSNDTLVICAGFEDRALAALKMVGRENPCRLVVISYTPFVKNNRVDEISDFYQQATGLNPEVLKYDRENPSGFGLTLVEAIGTRSGRTFIDVSAMSRLLIVQIIVGLSTRKTGLSNCTIIYTEAREYPPSQEEAQLVMAKTLSDSTFTALFLSSGVFEVTIVPELSSIALASTQTRLVVFPGFDAHHLTALRSELQPSRFTYIEGSPPNQAHSWRRDFIASINHLEYSADAERCVTSTLDYAQTLDCLLDIYQRHSLRERLLIAPTGSKMQTVAVGLLRAFLRDIQIVYPTPQNYISPDSYTKGCGATYTLALDGFMSSKSET